MPREVPKADAKAADELGIKPPATLVVNEDSGASEITRLGIPVGKDGCIAFDKMRDTTKKQLQQAFKKTSETVAGKQQLGLAAGETVQIIPDSVGADLWKVVGRIESIIAMKATKIDRDIANEVFTYSDAERKELGHPTALVMSKHLPDTAAKYSEEIALVSLVAGFFAAKLELAKSKMDERYKEAQTTVETTQQNVM